jgi:hypothetical protein
MEIAHHNAFEDWELEQASCECSWTGTLGDATREYDTDQWRVSWMVCPSCGTKLASMTNEATFEHIEELAAGGSRKAAASVAERAAQLAEANKKLEGESI